LPLSSGLGSWKKLIMRLSKTELEMLVTAYAKNWATVEPTYRPPEEVNREAAHLMKYGLLRSDRTIESGQPGVTSRCVYLLRPTPKGVEFVKNYDRVLMTKLFIGRKHVDLIAWWILYRLSPGQLPEFIVHREPYVRALARYRMDNISGIK